MSINWKSIVAGAALALAPLCFSQDSHPERSKESAGNMRRAIQFQRAKDRADASQARKERQHPSVSYSNADRRDEGNNTANRVGDPGEQQWKKHVGKLCK